MLQEFNRDLLELADSINNKDNKRFRSKLWSMFSKMRQSNTKGFYIDKVDRLCILLTGENYETLFINGIK